MIKRMLFYSLVTLTVVFLIFLKISPFSKQITYHLSIASPVLSLKPHVADDWSSFFVINHIFPRMSPGFGDVRSRTVFKDKSIHCEEEKLSPISKDCKRVVVSYELTENLKTCDGQAYTDEDFRKELSDIVKSKNWIFPNFKFCETNCFTFSNVRNIQHHLESIYLRFGWSKSSSNGVGISPYCFHIKNQSDTTIFAGELHTPTQKILISDKDDDTVDIYLYGNKENPERYQDLKFYNPIYFFLVTSKVIDSSIVQTIQKVFRERKIISKISAVKPFKNNKQSDTVVFLPDYLNECQKIAGHIERQTKRTTLQCLNISSFTENIVKKGLNWDSFVSPLTPGMPGQGGIEEQYFNKESNDNWLGRDPDKTQVILLGEASGVLQVKRNKFCSLRPNSLGLSDIVIEDFEPCD